MLRLLLNGCLLAAVASGRLGSVTAQPVPEADTAIAPGHQIRMVLLTSRTLDRFVSGIDSGQIWFRSSPRSGETSVSFGQLRTLFVQVGERPASSRGASIGVKVGPLIGLAAGLTYFFARGDFCCQSGTGRAMRYGAIGFVAGAGLGAITGGLIGLAYREPTWAPVDPRRLRLVDPAAMGVGLSVRF